MAALPNGITVCWHHLAIYAVRFRSQQQPRWRRVSLNPIRTAIFRQWRRSKMSPTKSLVSVIDQIIDTWSILWKIKRWHESEISSLSVMAGYQPTHSSNRINGQFSAWRTNCMWSATFHKTNNWLYIHSHTDALTYQPAYAWQDLTAEASDTQKQKKRKMMTDNKRHDRAKKTKISQI